MNDHITASPLSWPAGWPRRDCDNVVESRFGKTWHEKPSVHAAVRMVLNELRLMGVDAEDVIISTNLRLRLDGLPYSNQRDPDDPAAAVYWREATGTDRVVALDRFDRVGCNLWAIGKTLESLRGIERWGGGQILDRAFSGFVALPSPEMAGGVDPYELLGIDPDDPIEVRREAYRRARAKAHPDRGGSPELFAQLDRAARQIGLR